MQALDRKERAPTQPSHCQFILCTCAVLVMTKVIIVTEQLSLHSQHIIIFLDEMSPLQISFHYDIVCTADEGDISSCACKTAWDGPCCFCWMSSIIIVWLKHTDPTLISMRMNDKILQSYSAIVIFRSYCSIVLALAAACLALFTMSPDVQRLIHSTPSNCPSQRGWPWLPSANVTRPKPLAAPSWNWPWRGQHWL